MIVHLFKSGQAMITGHNTRVASTVPETKGTLMIGEFAFRIDGKTEIPKELPQGISVAKFASDKGKSYNIGSIIIKPNMTISMNAESDSVIDMLHKMDDLEDKHANLESKYQKLKAKVEYDSIGFITGEDKK